ncbi:hypothetical protein, partial [Sulfolobus acidocaldarius]|uniref:hypothetical protein n=1 Tax=Sulfolobus acidocaldarius TaxID=2285 RepID=UPI000B2CA9F4
DVYKRQKLSKYLEKTERIMKIYSEIADTPIEVINELKAQKDRLLDYINRYGDKVSPFQLVKS